MTRLKPPRSDGCEPSTSNFQPMRAGVAPVHLEQVAGEEVGLLAALGTPDLDDDVLVVVGVARQQQHLSSSSSRSMVASPASISAPRISRSSPSASAKISLGGVEVRLALEQAAVAHDDLFELLVAPGHRRVARLVGEHLGVGQARLDLEVLLFEVGEAVEHGTQGRHPGAPPEPPSATAVVGNGHDLGRLGQRSGQSPRVTGWASRSGTTSTSRASGACADTRIGGGGDQVEVDADRARHDHGVAVHAPSCRPRSPATGP